MSASIGAFDEEMLHALVDVCHAVLLLVCCADFQGDVF